MANRLKTDDELRALGVPQHVLDYRNGNDRVSHVPLKGIVIDEQPCPSVPVSREVAREELGRKIADARRRFRRAI